MSKKATIHTDGGARGNPGPAGIGAVIKVTNGEKYELAEYIGKTTNNQAEYRALLMALEKAKNLGLEELHCYADSLLVVNQLNREWKVKDKDIEPLFLKIWNLSTQFKKITFTHIRRELNKEADKLVNIALDKELKK